jgi:hypothetical protein
MPLSNERVQRLEAVRGWTWDPNETAWEEGFSHLRNFAEREGHTRVRQRARVEDYPLGNWVGNQRQAYRKGTLARKRVRRLEALPGWTWTPDADAWEKGFARLQSYALREGHTRVPKSYRDRDGFGLGNWLAQQRRQRATLGHERARRLESLPGWAWNSRETAWDDQFARLLNYVEREGDSRVPSSYHDRDGFRLGTWVANQRHRRRLGKLADDRARRLEALPGWLWDARPVTPSR